MSMKRKKERSKEQRKREAKKRTLTAIEHEKNKSWGGERGAIDTGHFVHRGPDCSAVLV